MKKINESFVCIKCKKYIAPAKKTCRDHCPYCFTSVHVDESTPGDRASMCKGMMNPVDYVYKNGDRRILFICSACGKQHRNKRAEDDNIENLLNIIRQ